MLAGLPRHQNTQLSNIHLISFSDSVSTLEMAKPIAHELFPLESEGIQVFDAYLQQNVRVLAPLIFCICDNPRASELLNHRGSAARRFCRMCLVRSVLLWSARIFWWSLYNNRLTEKTTQRWLMFLEPNHRRCSRSCRLNSQGQKWRRHITEYSTDLGSTTTPFFQSLLIFTGTVTHLADCYIYIHVQYVS